MKQLVNEGNVISNPAYYIQKGNTFLINRRNDDDIQSSILNYKVAKEKSGQFSLYACLNLAMAQLCFKKNKGENQEIALKELKQVLGLIDKTYRPNLVTMNTIIGKIGGEGKISEHIMNHMNILGQIEDHCSEAISVIEKACSNKNNVDLKQFPILEAFAEEERINYYQAVGESSLNGLTHLFKVTEKLPRPWLNILAVTMLGIAQIVGGVLLTCYTGGTLGLGFIREGISDLIQATKAAITGTFNWTAYAIQKGVSYAVSFFTSSVTAIQSGIQSIREVTIGVGNAVAKEGLKLAAKQVSLELTKGVAKECLNLLVDYAADKIVLKNIEEKITATVADTLNEAFSKDELFKECLSIDVRNGDNKFQQIFINEGMKILIDKKSHWMGAWSQFWKGVVSGTFGYAGKGFVQSWQIKNMMIDLTLSTNNFLKELKRNIEQNSECSAIKAIIEQKSNTVGAGDQPKIENEEEMKKQTKGTCTIVSNISVLDKPNSLSDPCSLFNPLSETDETFQSALEGEVQNIRRGYFSPSSLKAVVKAFQGPLAGKMTNSIQSNLVQPVTSAAVSWGVDRFTNGWQTSIEKQRETHLKRCKYVFSEKNVMKGDKTARSDLKPQSEIIQENIQDLNSGKEQGSKALTLAAIATKRQIRLYDEKGTLLQVYGEGEPLKITYTAPKNGESNGHYTAKNGTRVISTGDNNCLLDTVAALTGRSTDTLRTEMISVIEKNPVTCEKMFQAEKALSLRDTRTLYYGGRNSQSDEEDESSQICIETAIPKVQKYRNNPGRSLPKKKLIKLCHNIIQLIVPRGRTPLERGRDGHRQLEGFMKALDLPDSIKFEFREKRNGQIARFDVIDTVNKLIIDFKFGESKMSPQQFFKYRGMHRDYEILTIHPNNNIFQYNIRSGKLTCTEVRYQIGRPRR
jgi:hypothetical protein